MLGDLSARYESSGDAGAIGRCEGDAGGASYGAFQFAANAGVPGAFVAWLGEQGYPGAETLAGAGAPGTEGFDAAWRAAAEADPEGFAALQRMFVQEEYYEPAVARLRSMGVDAGRRSETLRQVVWSAAVQYGPGCVDELFREAVWLAGTEATADTLDDATLIANVYAVRASDEWMAGSPRLRPGLRARFAAECREALAMLG